jgi:hypothetical protein
MVDAIASCEGKEPEKVANYLTKSNSTGNRLLPFIKDPQHRAKVLYNYDELGEKYKKFVQTRFGDPYSFIAKEPIRKMVAKDLKAHAYFLSYGDDGERTLSPEHVDKYTKVASWLNMLIKLNADKKIIKKQLNLSLEEFWSHVSEIIKTDKIDLPSTYQRLRNKMAQYQEKGYDCLIDWRFGNKLAAKVIDNDLSSDMLLSFIENPLQYDDVMVCYLYNNWAVQNGYKSIEAATVGVWRRKKEAEITIGRYGNSAFNEKYIRQVKGFAPTAPGYLWESDDYNLNYYFIDPELPAAKRDLSRYVSYIVADSNCGLVLGKSYRQAKSPVVEMVYLAYIDAMYYVRSLTGGWHIPFETKVDHWQESNIFPYLQRIGNFVPPAHQNKHRGYIEQLFGSDHAKRAEKIVANSIQNYNGNNITAANTGVNVENLYLNRKNRPLVGSEAEMQIEKFFHCMRKMPAFTRNNMAAESKEQQWLKAWNKLTPEQKRPISDLQFLTLFGIKHAPQGRSISITNRGVEPQINGVQYSYDLPDYLNKMHLIGAKVNVIYDPYDMSRVLITNEEDIRFIAKSAVLQPRALQDTYMHSRTALNMILSEKADQVNKVATKMIERHDNVDAAFDPEAVMLSGFMLKDTRNTIELDYHHQQTNYSNKNYDPLDQM